jgi:threonine synthase
VRKDAWPGTIAHAIENSLPPSGNEVLRKLRAGAGLCAAVSDNDIMDAQNALAHEGLLVQPAAAVPVAAASKLVADGFADRESHVVCVATGSGLKHPQSLRGATRGAAECVMDDLVDVVSLWLQTESKGERL